MAKKERPVSIIMPSYGLDGNEEVLAHFMKQKYKNYEIVIINDNPESKPSESLLRFIKGKNIRILTNKKNLGIAESFNRGIRSAKNEVIMVLCKDYFPKSRNWISKVVEKLYSDEKIACVLSPIVTPKEVWRDYDFITKIFTFRHIENPLCGGANYKKSTFKKVGYYNSKNFAFAGEDCDMHYRMKEANLKIGYVDEGITHLHNEKRLKFTSVVRKVFKKEFAYGVGHGALKKKYGLLRRIGWLDFEIRILLLLGAIFGWVLGTPISMISLLILAGVFILAGIRGYSRLGWWPGLFFFPITSAIIFVVQTVGAVIGFSRGR